MTISADDARRAAKANEKTEIQKFVIAIDARIERAVAVGKMSMEFDMRDNNQKFPSPSQQEAVKSHYAKHGYKFNEHRNADPCDPRERNWTAISWA